MKNKIKAAIFSLTMIFSVAFAGEALSTTGSSPFSVSAQTVTVKRKSRPGIARRAYRGGRYVVRKTWDGTKWVSKRVWVATKWTGKKAWRGTKKVGRTVKRVVY